MKANRAVILLVVAAMVASGLTGSVRGAVTGVDLPGGLAAQSACGVADTGQGSGDTVPAAALLPATYQALVDPAAPGAKGQPQVVAHEGAQLVVGRDAITAPVTIGITPLSTADLPQLDPGMTNVTQGPRQGYRFTPHPFTFQRQVQISVPYDPELVGQAFNAQDVHTYFFDEADECWRPLDRVSVDEKKHVVVSLTNHFTDMVNATVTVPDHPEGASFDPNQIKGIQAADPGSGVNLIAAPVPGNNGDASLTYPIEIPPGRAGLQPRLNVQYNSAGGASWLGTGWDLPLPAITVDTRWGVPRYDARMETETYLLSGAQLSPVANRGQLQARSAEKVFHARVEGQFAQIVRHGSAPANYTWEVVDKAGTHYLYGGAPESTLADDAGAVFQWALREVRDPHGNLARYHTVRQADTGVAAGGSVPGSNLYLQKITYTGSGQTEGPYAVTFVRDRELNEPRRADVSIDARGGFKRVTADLLRRVEVTLNGQLIRRYELSYRTGAFFKTLLKSIAQFGEDGKLFNTHTLDYYDDVRDAAGAYQAFSPVGWTSPDDNLRNGTVDAISDGAGEAGALNGNTSTSAGGHLYVGFGSTATKNGSVGVKTGFNSTEDTGLLALVDVDGDNLPDKVFRNGGGVAYRKNLAAPGGQPRFADAVTPLRNLPGILSQTSDSLTVGVEGYLGVAAQLDHVDTFTTTDQYLSDVNGDGITDLVNGGSVLFGRIGPDGTPVYGVSGDTPVPIGSAPVDADGLLGDFSADRERQIDSHPLVDTVRRWVAPFDGTVRVSGPVRLVEDTSPQRAAYTKADGVRVAIQREDGELWSALIGPTDYAERQPADVDAVPVKRGDRLYFRVQSRFDGAFDQVSWDPQVTYAGRPAVTDVNGLNVFSYQASRDFTLGGRTSSVTVPVTGTLHLSGALTKKAATTDDVTAVITRGTETVFEKTLPAGETGDIPLDLDVPVQQGQQLRWRVRIDSPIDLDQIEWAPKAEYTAAQGVARLTDAEGNPVVTVQPPYDIDMYPADSLTGPQESFTAPVAGDLIVEPALTVDDPQLDARVVFTVKAQGRLLAKRAIDVVDGQVPADLRLTVPVAAGDELFFDFSTLDRTLAGKLSGQSVLAGFDPETLQPAPSALHSTAEEGAFAQPYRGWGVLGYNGNRDRAEAPIAQADLVANEDYRDQLPTDVDPQRDRDEFAADPRVTPPKFFTFSPAPARQRWEAADLLWQATDTASSSRLGSENLNLPTAAELADVTAVPRMSRSTQISLTGAVGGGVISVGGSIATGDSTGELDYLDMNGDRFPDVIGDSGIQYTDPTGQLGATRAGLPDGNVRRTSTETGNAGAGSAGRTISTGRGYAAPPAYSSANTSDSGNDLPPLGIGGNLGTGSSSGKFDLLDINGDGLPDRVYADGRAALNLGYRFAAPEPWPGGAINEGSTRNAGVNVGFNTDFYGFAGGASFSKGSGSTSNSLMDVNGDGLADRVFEGSPIRVALNTGNGFAPPQPFFGSLSGINTDVNAQLGGGAYFTFSFCFLLVTACIVTNPGASFATGASRTEQTLRDINGDGYADHLQSTSDDQLVVAENKTGRTNLLRSVQRPLGSRIDLDYARDGNTYDQPDSKWVLSRVAVNDGHPGDGQDVQLSTYRYSGGTFDRLEREFRGYQKVVEEHRDPGNSDALFRSVTREYRTDSHYTQGLVAREQTADGAGHLFYETEHSYQLRDVVSPDSSADPVSTTATIFPQLVRTDQRFFEGQATAGKTTHTEMSYDQLGNLTRELDAGDAGPADDVETRIRYSAENGLCQDRYIMGTGIYVEVRAGGSIMRQRESTVDCLTGDIVRHRATLADGTSAVSDFTHFENGNIESATEPRNADGTRYRLDYTYDPVLATYPASVQDIFGYRSTATYNAKYGLPDTTTDVNNQQTKYTYDKVGRTETVKGPYELAGATPSIAFEYHPEATVPFAVTRHIDRNTDGSVRNNTIDTITFTDGLKRVLQTKKDATLGTGTTAATVEAMTVSGKTVYDFLGRAVEQSYPTTEPKGSANTTFNPAVDPVQPTRTGYDVLDRSTRTVLPDNTATSTAYGFGPDRDGATQLETAITDANGNVRRVYADVRAQITAVKEANPTGGQPVIWTSYGYDPLGQLTSVADDQNNVTTAAYDNFGRRTLVDSPDTGRTETAYDLADNPIREVTANLAGAGQSIEYDYEFNRLVGINYPVFSKNNVSYQYGAPGAADNGADRVIKVTDSAGTLARKFGPLGEVVQETRTVPGVLSRTLEYTTKYRFDTWNRVQQMTYPDGEVLSYHYNSGGLVDGASGVKGRSDYQYLKRLDYDKFEQRVLLQAGNGTQTKYTYDAADRRLATLKAATPSGKEFQNQRYGYDDVGNITDIQNDVAVNSTTDLASSNDLGGPVKQAFGYDNLYRLTSSQGEFKPNKNKVDRYQLSMSYDSLNNITAKDQKHDLDTTNDAAAELVANVDTADVSTVSQPGTTYQYAYAYSDGQPHAPDTIGPFSMRYDANGNLIARDEPAATPHRRQQIWDEENRLACTQEGSTADPIRAQNPASCNLSGTKVRFSYDDQGNRVVKNGGSGDVNVYPNRAFSQRDNTTFKHIFIGDTRLVTKLVEPEKDAENTQFYFHPDHLGSTGYGTDQDGRVIDHQQYFPSGETWVDETRDEPTPYQFSGKELDEETGLYYYGARYYDPRTAVWQSTDPAADDDYLDGAGNGGVFNPGNLNPYSYAYQNPVKYTDPDGRFVFLLPLVPPAVAAAAEATLWLTGIAAAGALAVWSMNRNQPAPPTDSTVLEQRRAGPRAGAATPPAGGEVPPPPIIVPGANGLTGSGTNTQAGTDATTTTKNEEDGIHLSLKYRKDWTPDQRLQAARKVDEINRAAQGQPGLRVTKPARGSITAASRYREAHGISQEEWDEQYGDFDVDHELDLQLGGADAIGNMKLLDKSVNRSLGAQTYHQTKGRLGAKITGASISDRTGGP